MAMASTLERKFITFKLEVLREQRNCLQTLVDEADLLLNLGSSWLENSENATYEELSQSIERMIMHLGDKSLQPQVLCEKISMNQASAAASSLSDMPTSINKVLPTRDELSDEGDQLEKLMVQMKSMQETISSLTSSTVMMSEKQTCMEKSIEKMSVKYLKRGQVNEINAELKKLSEKLKEAVTQQDKRMKNMDNKIQAAIKEQSEMKEREKEHKQEKRKFEKQSQEMSSYLHTCEGNINDLNVRVNFLETLHQKIEEYDSLLHELTKSDDTTKQQQHVMSEELQKVKEKITAAEVNYSDLSKETERLCKDMETNYKMVCKITAGRLAPLERLKDIFNDKLDARVENINKLDNVCVQMAGLLSKYCQLEAQCNQSAVGFTARLPSKCFISQDTIIRNFTTIIFSTGDHFNPNTGTFTAPVDGVYAAFLSGLQISRQVILLYIVKLPSTSQSDQANGDDGDNDNDYDNDDDDDDDDDEEETIVARSGTHQFVGAGSIFAVVNLKDGERLCVQCKLASKEAYLSEWTTFTCCRIG